MAESNSCLRGHVIQTDPKLPMKIPVSTEHLYRTNRTLVSNCHCEIQPINFLALGMLRSIYVISEKCLFTRIPRRSTSCSPMFTHKIRDVVGILKSYKSDNFMFTQINWKLKRSLCTVSFMKSRNNFGLRKLLVGTTDVAK